MRTLSVLFDMMVEEQPKMQLVKAQCLRSRLNTCDCRRCLDVCPSGALSLIEREIHFDPLKCTSCMSCLAVCPNDALDGGYDLVAILAEISSQSQVVVSCNRSMQKSTDEVAVPCQGVFSEESLLVLGRSGCDSITFDMVECRTCDNHHAAARFRDSLRQILDIAESALTTSMVVEEDTLNVERAETRDRRSYLSHLLSRVSQMPSAGQTTGSCRETKERMNGRKVPAKVRILERLINRADPWEKGNLQALCNYSLIINDACTPCQRCSAICPTGALKLNRSVPERQLLFEPGRCSGCGLCESFCKNKALTLRVPSYLKRDLNGPRMLKQTSSITKKGSSAYVENPPR